MESAKRMHKFALGQSVSLQSTMFNRDAARGAYKVTKQLPERDGELEYQIKRPGEPHEHVVKERDLSAETHPTPDYVSDFLATSDGLSLTRAFVRIKGPALRRRIVRLVQ
jgi:hypothetical protein